MVKVASELYAEGGGRRLSFGVVAERTGLTKATIFHYFPKKEALLLAVFESLGQRLDETAAGWFEAPPQAYATRLDRVISSLVDFYGADPLNARILCHGLLETANLAAHPSEDTTEPTVFEQFLRRFVRFIEGGIAAGEFYRERPMALILAIGGVILFEFMLPERGRRFSDGVPIAKRKTEMTRLVRRAVVRAEARLRAASPDERARTPGTQRRRPR